MGLIDKFKAISKTAKEFSIPGYLVRKMIKTSPEKAVDKYAIEEDKEYIKGVFNLENNFMALDKRLKPFLDKTVEGKQWWDINISYCSHLYTMKFIRGESL